MFPDTQEFKEALAYVEEYFHSDYHPKVDEQRFYASLAIVQKEFYHGRMTYEQFVALPYEDKCEEVAKRLVLGHKRAKQIYDSVGAVEMMRLALEEDIAAGLTTCQTVEEFIEQTAREWAPYGWAPESEEHTVIQDAPENNS